MLEREYIGIEKNEDFLKLSIRRIKPLNNDRKLIHFSVTSTLKEKPVIFRSETPLRKSGPELTL